MNKKDCFAIKNSKCQVLKATQCADCSFYKTNEKFIRELKKADKRLHSLDSAIQAHIAEKYHSVMICR